MALTFQKIESIKFGDLVVEPKLNRELELRVKDLKIDDDNLDEAREVLSQCFGSHKSAVAEFMAKNFYSLDYARLQVYLVRGQSGLDMFEKNYEKLVQGRMDKAVEDSLSSGGAKNE